MGSAKPLAVEIGEDVTVGVAIGSSTSISAEDGRICNPLWKPFWRFGAVVVLFC
jgi:hypothetical protein